MELGPIFGGQVTDEATFLGQLTAFTRFALAADADPKIGATCDALLHLASSSVLAFAESWEALYASGLSVLLRHDRGGDAGGRRPEPAIHRELLPSRETHLGHGDQELSDMAEGLTASLQSVAGDARLSALCGLLRRLAQMGKPQRVCILTAFQTTAEYLEYAEFPGVIAARYSVTRLLDADERAKALTAHAAGGGILIVTDAALGEDIIPPIDVLLHYDMPRLPEQMTERRSLVLGAAAGAPPAEFWFEDELRSLTFEQDLLRLHLTALGCVNELGSDVRSALPADPSPDL